MIKDHFIHTTHYRKHLRDKNTINQIKQKSPIIIVDNMFKAVVDTAIFFKGRVWTFNWKYCVFILTLQQNLNAYII